MKNDPRSVLAELRRLARRKHRDGMARFAIPSGKAFGVPMHAIHALAKRIGRSHELALALWGTGWYEARTLAAFVDEPARVTPAQMDRWCRGFDSWAICDTVCFHLFDRTPHAFGRIERWARRKGEFQRRAAFALLASVGAHDREAEDAPFARSLPLIEEAAFDERNFVKKGVSWALRVVGRRSLALHRASVALAKRLVASGDPAARWVGKDALLDLSKPAVLARLKRR
ncbi:MAG TPA: DNA alkylation repair protein [Planctomycetota bacterium]|nr:DNA alkylation repair protein [Planctomycetota bacterium]